MKRVMKERIDAIMSNIKEKYQSPEIIEELIDEKDIITASDNDVDAGELIDF